jgi:hypothetical protein
MGFKKHPGFQGQDFSNATTCNQYSFAVAHTATAHQYSVISDDNFKMTMDINTTQIMIESLDGNNDRLSNSARMDELLDILKTWIDGQLSYYDNDTLMSSKYPPHYPFNTFPCN